MFLRVSAAVFLAGSSAVANAADWQHLYTGQTGKMLVDLNSIQRSPGDSVIFWAKTVKSKPERMADRMVDEIVRKKEMDCKGQRDRTVASRWYYKDQYVWGEDWLGDWDAVTPGTNGEVVMEFVCMAANILEAD